MKVKGGLFVKRKGTSGRCEGEKEAKVGGKYDQITLYTCIKMS
jgi:hypothetical protein